MHWIKYSQMLLCSLLSLCICGFATSRPIHDAVKKGDREGIEQALKAGFPDLELNSMESGFTPLDLAVKIRDKALVEFLLEKGASVKNGLFSQQTPLHVAAAEGFQDIAEVLLNRGAKINAVSGGITPLHAAVSNKRYEMVIFLLKRGANPNLQYYAEPRPLNVAARMGDRKMVEILLAAGAEVSPVTSSSDYVAPIFDAVRSGNKEVVELLIARGANLNVTRYYIGDPLACAISFGHVEIVKFLLAKGVSVSSAALEEIMRILDMMNIQESLPQKDEDLLCTAAKIPEILDILLSKDAKNINTRLPNGCTLLHLAAGQKDPILSEQLVSILLERGADPNITEMLGRKPRAIAEAMKHTRVTQLLADAEVGRRPSTRALRGLGTRQPRDFSHEASVGSTETGDRHVAPHPTIRGLSIVVVAVVVMAVLIVVTYFLVKFNRQGRN